jgi:hypothetical protein
MIKSSRLRYIEASTAEDLTLAVDNLPFKVEIKEILVEKSKWYCFFILPEHEQVVMNNIKV